MTNTFEIRKDAEQTYNENGGLVIHTCKSYYPTFIDNEDLLQEGRIGLWYACNTYDENGGATFANYAIKCIRLHMHQYLRNQTLVTKCPSEPNKSLDETVKFRGEECSTRYETVEGADLGWLDYNGLYLALSERQKTILKARLAGKECREIEKIVGVSHTTLSKELKTIRRLWEEYI